MAGEGDDELSVGALRSPEAAQAHHQQAVAETTIAASYSEHFYSGPTPPAGYLRELEEIQPGLAERCFDMAVNQMQHRHHLEKSVVDGSNRRATTGQWMGFAAAMTSMVFAFVLILAGHGVAGFAVLIGEAALLAGVFVVGKLINRNELRRAARPGTPIDESQPQLPFDDGLRPDADRQV